MTHDHGFNPSTKYPMRTAFDIPMGPRVYVQDDEIGGRTYFSDEVGGGVFVWSTSLVSSGTLLAAIKYEAELQAAGVKTQVELEPFISSDFDPLDASELFHL